MTHIIEITSYKDEKCYQSNNPGFKIRSYITRKAMITDLKYLLRYSDSDVYVVRIIRDEFSINGN